MPEGKKHVGPYVLKKTIGNGSFGKVKLAENIFTKEQVAIKIIKQRRMSGRQRESSLREINIMKLLNHPNIIKLIDVVDRPQEDTTYIVVEYVAGGELFDYIVSQGRVKETEARRFFRQIISAVEYCHANLVVHRDLKPENLLLDSEGNIKISDFGLSNVIEPTKLMESFCGSPLYAAPEILRAEKYVAPPVDVWSMGVILYALLCGQLPWEGETQSEICFNSVNAKYPEPDELSTSVRDLIRRMLTVKPSERATVDELRRHSWVNEGYSGPPESLLPVKQPVVDVNDDILRQLAALGFTDLDDSRAKILNNENSQVVAMYHLLLEREVQAELKAMRRRMTIPKPAPGMGSRRASIATNRLALTTISEISPSHKSSSTDRCEAADEADGSAPAVKSLERSSKLSRVVTPPDVSSSQGPASRGCVRRGSLPPVPITNASSPPPDYPLPTLSPRRNSNSPPKSAQLPPLDFSRADVSLGAAQSPRSPRTGFILNGHAPVYVPQTPLLSPACGVARAHEPPQRRGSAPVQPISSNSDQRRRRSSSLQPLESAGDPTNNSSAINSIGSGKSAAPVSRSFPPYATSYASVAISGASRSSASARRGAIAPLPTASTNGSASGGSGSGESVAVSPRNYITRFPPREQPNSSECNSTREKATPISARRASIAAAAPGLSQVRPQCGDTSSLRGGCVNNAAETQSGNMSPRSIKGPFKWSATSALPPDDVVRELKRVFEERSLFTKRKGSYLFHCIDDEHGIRFQAEVCQTDGPQGTGLHLKRLDGDVWKYKSMCSVLLEKLHL